MKWQDVRDKLKTGVPFLIPVVLLLGSLLNLTGMDYTVKVDEVSSFESNVYLNVTTTYWRVCFDHLGESADPIIKKVNRGRTLWVNLDKSESVVNTEPAIAVDWLVPTYGGRWRPVKDGDCWERGTVNKNLLVLHKKPSQEVEWSFDLQNVKVKNTWDAYPISTKVTRDIPFDVEYTNSGFTVTTDEGYIRMDYVDKTTHEKTLVFLTGADRIKRTGSYAALNTPVELKEDTMFKITSDLPLSVDGCVLRYESLVVDLCDPQTPQQILSYDGYWLAEANTAVYTSNVLSVTGGSVADPISPPTIYAEIADTDVFWNNSATDFFCNSTFQVNTSSYAGLSSGQTLTLEQGMNLYGTYVVNKATLYMNDSENDADIIHIYSGGNLTVVGTTGSNVIPNGATTHDAKIDAIGRSNAKYTLDCDSGGAIDWRDAEIRDHQPIEVDPACNLIVYRTNLFIPSNYHHDFHIGTGDKVEYVYWGLSNISIAATAAHNFFTAGGTTPGFNFSHIYTNITSPYQVSSTRSEMMENYYVRNNFLYDSESEDCNFRLSAVGGSATSYFAVEYINVSFKPHNAYTKPLKNCTFVDAYQHNWRSYMKFKYYLHIDVDAGESNVSVEKQVYNGTAGGTPILTWTAVDDYETGADGRLTTRTKLEAVNYIFKNESNYTVYRVNVSRSGYNTTSKIINYTDDGWNKLYNFSISSEGGGGGGATQDWSGGSYTGVAPNCSGASNISITEDTTWLNMEWINLSCDVTVQAANFTMGNVTLTFNSSDSQQYGMWFKYGREMTVRIENSTWRAADNFTFFNKRFESALESNWGYAGGSHYSIRWIFRNNYFYNLGQNNDGGGTKLKAVGSQILHPKSVIYDNNTFIDCGNAMYVISNSATQASINATNNNCTNIIHTCINWQNGNETSYDGGEVFFANNTYCEGRWAYEVPTTASICHFTAITINEYLGATEGINLGYSSDAVGPNTNVRYENNYWHNTRMGSDLNKQIDGAYIHNITVRDIEQIAVYIYGGSRNILIEDFRAYNVTPNPDHATTNGLCFWTPQHPQAPIDYGDTWNITVKNYICDKARMGFSISDGGNTTLGLINIYNSSINDTTDDGFWISDDGAVKIVGVNFSNIGVAPIDADVGANVTAYWNNFYDVSGFDVDTTKATFYNHENKSGNYYANHTTPDADNDGIVDIPFVISGDGGIIDLYPLAHPYNGTSAWMGAGNGSAPGDTTPPVITAVNKTIERGATFSHDANATDVGGSVDINTWDVSNADFDIDTGGIITNNTALSVGAHTMTISVLDDSSNNGTRDFKVTVQDTTDPRVIAVSKTVEIGNTVSHDANVTDISSIQTGTWHVSHSSFDITTGGVVTNNTALSVGSYAVTVSVLDASSNNGSKVWNLTIQDTVSPRVIVVDKTMELGDTTISHDANVTDISSIQTSTWHVSHAYFDITTGGVITNATGLFVASYAVTVSVLDASSNNGSKVWNLTVQDTTAPVITAANKTLSIGGTLSHDANATDFGTISTGTWNVNDSTFSINPSGIITNSSALSSGAYYVEISVEDTSGNNGSRDWVLTVGDSTAPVVDSVVKTLYETATSIDLNATDNVGIDTGTWTVNDTKFNISTLGIIRNTTALTTETDYYLNVCVNDTIDNQGCAVSVVLYRESGVGFNYSYGGSITSLVFRPSTLTSQNVAPTGQTASVPAYIVCNNGGTVSADGFEAKLNQSLPSGLSMKMYTSNSPSSALTLTTSYQYVNGTGSASLGRGACNYYWVWIDLSNPTEGGTFDILWRLT